MTLNVNHWPSPQQKFILGQYICNIKCSINNFINFTKWPILAKTFPNHECFNCFTKNGSNDFDNIIFGQNRSKCYSTVINRHHKKEFHSTWVAERLKVLAHIMNLKQENVSFSPNVMKLRIKGCHTNSTLFRVFDLILRGPGLKYKR